MLEKLRIICSILAALCVVAVPFVGIYAGWFYVMFLGIGLLVFFMLTLLFKYFQDEKEHEKEKTEENKKTPPKKD